MEAMPQKGSYLGQALFAAFVIAVAALARWGLDVWLGDHLPYVTFFVAIAIISYYASTRVTAISIIGAWLVTDFFFVPPRMSFIIFSREPAYLVGTLTYFMVAGATLATAYGMHRAREQVARAQLRNEAVLLSALDCLITMDHAGRIVDFNPAAERTFGHKRVDVIGRPVADVIIPHRLRQNHWEGLRRYLSTREHRVLNQRLEMPALRADGSEFPCELSIIAIEQPDQPAFFTGFLRDISERKLAEAELQRHQHHLQQLVDERTQQIVDAQARLRQSERLATIGTLSAGLGHDIGNILMPMKAHISTIKTKVEAPEVIPNLTINFAALERGFDYLANLASSLRLLARDPEHGSNQGAMTDVARWCIETEPLLRAMVARPVRLIYDIARDVTAVGLSKHLLTQVVFNLVQNAAQALESRPGGEIMVRAAMRAAGMVEISVTDNGPGMTDEVKARCLEPFFTTKTRGISSGLGLAVVNGIVKNVAGGELQIDSEPGRGTTFRIILPERRKSEIPTPRIVAIVSIAEPRMRAIVTSVLSSLNCQVEHASPELSNDGKVADAVVIGGTVVALDEFTHADLPRLRQTFQGVICGLQNQSGTEAEKCVPSAGHDQAKSFLR